MTELPSTAKAVIIGGGIIGCSTAYHLAKMGWTDTVLLERKKLTSGTTFHAAGLVGQLRSDAAITQLLGYSVDLYKKLEEETGLGTGWKMNGGLRLACNEERWTEVKRQATTAHSFGLDMQLLTPKEAQDLWPLMDIGDVIGAAFLPTDGQANPSDITQALAKGARMAGAKIFEDTKVTDLEIDNGKIRAVNTEHGRIECEKVIVCAGQWTRDFAAKFGVNVPLVPMEHQYMVTEPFGVPGNLPTLRDPDRLTYYKEEVGGLVMGGHEANPIPWAVNGIPQGFHYTLLDSNFDHFEQLMELSLGQVPALETAGIKTLTNGPESYTPDGNFIVGEAPELANFFVGAGFNAFGIASGGGAGMVLAEWAAKGEPRLICGPPTFAALAVRISTQIGSAPARSRPMANITPWPGRTKNMTAVALAANHRSMMCSRIRARVSAKNWGGSARTGSQTPRGAKRPRTNTALAVRIGSPPWVANIRPRARLPCCSIRLRMRNSR